jgi:hypothetical protein
MVDRGLPVEDGRQRDARWRMVDRGMTVEDGRQRDDKER